MYVDDDSKSDSKREAERLWLSASTDAAVCKILQSNIVATLLKCLCRGKVIATTHDFVKSNTCGYEARFFNPPYAWFRAKAHGEFTVEHSDVYYFKVV